MVTQNDARILTSLSKYCLHCKVRSEGREFTGSLETPHPQGSTPHCTPLTLHQ